MSKLYVNFVRGRTTMGQIFKSESEAVRRNAALLAEDILSDPNNLDEKGDCLVPDGNVIPVKNLLTYICNFHERFNLG